MLNTFKFIEYKIPSTTQNSTILAVRKTTTYNLIEVISQFSSLFICINLGFFSFSFFFQRKKEELGSTCSDFGEGQEDSQRDETKTMVHANSTNERNEETVSPSPHHLLQTRASYVWISIFILEDNSGIILLFLCWTFC